MIKLQTRMMFFVTAVSTALCKFILSNEFYILSVTSIVINPTLLFVFVWHQRLERRTSNLYSVLTTKLPGHIEAESPLRPLMAASSIGDSERPSFS